MRKKFPVYAIAFLLLCSMFSEDGKNRWFTKGVKFTFAVYDQNEEMSARYEAEVMNTYTRNDTIFSESTTTWYDNENEKIIAKGSLDYRRDSSTFISSLANVLPANANDKQQVKILISGTPMIYPLVPKTGMNLQDAGGTITYQRQAGKTITVYKLTKRTVLNPDTISGDFGSIPCWVISSEESIEVMGKEKKDPMIRQVKEWYSPEYGVVKTQYSSEIGVEQVRQLMEVKQGQ